MASPIIIDIEASGFGKGGYPIEVGYVSRNGHPWCSLIYPRDDWTHWDSAAEKLHKISRDTLLAHGKSAAKVAQHLNDVFHNQTVYTDGWLQDFTWMSQLFDYAGITPLFKMDDLRNVLTPYQQSIWHEVKQSILNDYEFTRHRASVDAQVLQLTWIKTTEKEASLDLSQADESRNRLAGVF